MNIDFYHNSLEIIENFCHALKVPKNMTVGSFPAVMFLNIENSSAQHTLFSEATNNLFHFLQNLP